MRNLVLKLFMICVVLLAAVYVIYPPQRTLKLGKDLRGGTSLVYSVQIDPGQDAKRILNQTIDVLKERVDPGGTRDVSMVPQGRDRIEISFPQSNDRVRALRDTFEAELAKLQQTVVSQSELERVMALPAQERDAAIDQLMGGDAARADRLKDAADSLETIATKRAQLDPLSTELETLQAELDAARQIDPDDEDAQPDLERIEQLQAQVDAKQGEFDTLVSEIAQLELGFDDARQEVLARAVHPEEVRRALELSDQPIQIYDKKSKDYASIPGPRQTALNQLKTDHPELAAQIDQIVATYDAYASQATGFEDPADMIRLLQGAGVLDFRITVDPGEHPDEQRLRDELQERGPRNVQSSDTVWLKIAKVQSFIDDVAELEALRIDPAGFFSTRQYVVERFEGEYYMLAWDIRGSRLLGSTGNWSVARAFPSQDQIGKPAIGFEMDAEGAVKLGELTGAHRGDRMAIILDDRIMTAPNVNDRITRSGIIMGQFTQDEIDRIILVMQAGSLSARLSPQPISVSTLGPNLGADNLRKGLVAGLWALAIVSVFMIAYYYLCGFIAFIALTTNALLILAAMAMSMQAFTLPGIAGVILTFGMAVDANVLIYERIREELRAGEELKAAVRLGFSKALSSIVDANVTNLIVCVVLYQVGTPEIKGFALTLGIGVVSTMFSALVVARLIFAGLVDLVGIRKLHMLPMTIPAVERILEPKFNWMKARYVFLVISIIGVSIGLGMVVKQRGEMLDLEFRGGVMVELDLVDPATGDPHLMLRQDVEDKIQAIAEGAPDDSVLKGLRGAVILPVDPEPDGVTSSRFVIKTLVTDQIAVQESIVAAFATYLEGFSPLTYDDMNVDNVRDAPVYPIITGRLREDVDRGTYRADISDHIGGVVILVDDLLPAPPLDSLQRRLDIMRAQPDFSQTLVRNHDVIVLLGDETAVQAAAIVVSDNGIGYFDDEQAWWEDMASVEWRLVQEAFNRSTTPAQAQLFSPAIAQTFRAQAIIAVLLSFLLIMIYIWVRFGSVRYSLAAIVTLLHDVLTVIGLIALAEILYDSDATAAIARQLGILPFKIDLSLVAAILTIVGYSLNDTIIIMDRIRENRGKLDYATQKVVNLSINQTISRTVITSGTTLLAVLILYIFGGEGVRAFSYALLIGVVVGTYSSIAVAAPLVWSRKSDRTAPEEGTTEV